MATITAISSSIQDEPLNLLDPATWVGGAVPGPGDTAVLPHTVQFSKYRNQGSETLTSAYYVHPLVGPWSGSQITKGGVTHDVHIQAFSMADLDFDSSINDPNNSGSFYAKLYGIGNPAAIVKIDYKTRGTTGATYFYSCSVDQSYRPWSGSLFSASYTDGCMETSSPHTYPTLGRFYYNNTIFFRNFNQYQLTGSQVWEVDHIDLGNYSELTVRDDAQITLTGATPRVDFTYAAGQKVQFFDRATLHISSSNTTTNSRDGIDAYNESSIQINISGSANYSSSFVSESVSANSQTIRITDPSAFSEGDIVSIEQKDLTIVNHHIYGSPNQNYSYNIGKTRSYLTSSNIITTESANAQSATDLNAILGMGGTTNTYGSVTNDIHEDELARFITGSGDTFVVAKYMGKRGSVEKDHGTYTHESYQQTFSANSDFFTGSMRAVTVDSTHRSYAAGDLVVINKKPYRVQAVTSLLSQSFELDFKNGANAHEGFYHNDQVRSGSMTAQTGYSNTYYYYDEIYRKFAVGEYSGVSVVTSGSVGSESATCLYLNSSSLKSYHNPVNANRYDTYLAMHAAPNHYSAKMFSEGEVEISASITDNLLGTDPQLDSGVGIGYPYTPFQMQGGGSQVDDTQVGWETDGNLSNRGQQFIVRPYYGASLRPPDNINYGAIIPFKNFTSSAAPGTPYNLRYVYGPDWQEKNAQAMSGSGVTFAATGSGQSFSVKFVREGTHNKWFYKDHEKDNLLFENFTNQQENGAVHIALLRWAKIYSITIKTRKQLLLIDAAPSDTFTRLDEIQEGGVLKDQPANKLVKWIGTEIEDPMSYKNLLWDYYYKRGDTNILPAIHGATFNNINWSDSYANERYNGTTPFELKRAGGVDLWSYIWNNTASYANYDFGTPVSFDKIGYIWAGSTAILDGSRDNITYATNGYIEDVRFITSSNNTFDEATYGDWGGNGGLGGGYDDERRSTGLTGIRYFTGSLINGKTLKASGNGTYVESDPFFIGLYSGSLSAPRQIKLKNTNNFVVGDEIFFYTDFVNSDDFNVAVGYNGLSNIRPSSVTNYNTMTPAEITGSTNGGFSQTYEITAIDTATKIITLDRDPVYQHLFEGTIVLKANRGGVRLTTDNRGRHYGGCNIYSNYNSKAITVEHAYIEGTSWIVSNSTYYDNINIQREVVAVPSWGWRAGIPTQYDVSNNFYQNIWSVGGKIGGGQMRNQVIRAKTSQYNLFYRGGDDGCTYRYVNCSPIQKNINFATHLNGGAYGLIGYAGQYFTSVVSMHPTIYQKYANIRYTTHYDYDQNATIGAATGWDFKAAATNLPFFYENIVGYSQYGGIYTTSWQRNHGQNSERSSKRNDTHKTPMNSGLLKWPQRRAMRYHGIQSYGFPSEKGVAGDLVFNNPEFIDASGARNTIGIGNNPGAQGTGHPFTIVELGNNEYKLLKTGFKSQGAYSEESFDNFQQTQFYVTQDCNVQLTFSLDYKWSNVSLNGRGEYQEYVAVQYPIPNYSAGGYTLDGEKIPKIVLIEFSDTYPAGRTIAAQDMTPGNPETYSTINFNQTFSLTAKATYVFAWVSTTGRMLAPAHTLGYYRNPSYSIATPNPDLVKVMRNTFGIERQFQKPTIGESSNRYRDELDNNEIVRTSGDTSQGVRFFKVKM